MLSFTKNLLRLFFCMALLIFSVACEITEEEKKALDTALDTDQNETPDIDREPLPAQCFSLTHIQPDAEITKKIDILFMVDSSGSLNAERESIGDGVDAFIAELPEDVDFNIGVMVGHIGSRTGSLVRTYSNRPFVLKSSELSLLEIRTILRTRMRYVPGETLSDGGEAGLYSLNQALNAERLTDSQNKGFFREEAALAVVFVADENDICARYPEGVEPVEDPDNKEIPAFENYCQDVTAESVYQKLKAHQGERPLLVSGIIYNEESVFPQGGENEIGYGYTDIIEMGNGISIDLSGGRLHQGLSEIGSLATKKLQLVTEFKLTETDVLAESIQVEVDGQDVPFNYLAEVNEVHLTGHAGVERSEVYISYCKIQEDPPISLEISNLNISNITDTTAIVTWDTNEPSSTQVEVTRFSDGLVYKTFVTQVGVTRHTLFLTSLDPNTLYSIRAISENSSGIAFSDPATFRTKREGDGNPEF